MARYNDEAKTLASILKDKNRLKAQIAGSSEVIQIGKRRTEIFYVKEANVVMNTRDTTNDSKWGYMVWNTDAWQLTYSESQVEVTRRRWKWDTVARLEEGTYSDNINVSNGDIRIG